MSENPLLEELILNEVYFGKTESIQAIETQLDIFRKKYIDTKNKPSNDKDLIKLNRMIEEQFGFGSFSLMIIFDPVPNASTMPIDYSFDFARKQNNYCVDATTYKFKKEYNYACIVIMTTGLIFNNYFTTEEIMACLLNELGHNFYSCLTEFNGILSSVYNATLIANTISMLVSDFNTAKNVTNIMAKANTETLRAQIDIMVDSTPELAKLKNTPEGQAKLNELIDDAINNPTLLQKFGNIVPGIGIVAPDVVTVFEQSKAFRTTQDNLKKAYHHNKSIKQVVYGYKDIISLIMKNIVKKSRFIASILIKLKSLGLKFSVKNIIKCIDFIDLLIPYKSFISKTKNPLTWITLPVSYRVERAADNFATMYGYSAAEISYFGKMETNDKSKLVGHFIRNNPVIGIMYDIILAPSKILNGVFDGSPVGISKAYDQIKMLKYELSKQDLDPKMRAVIEDDIALCESNIKKLVDITNGAKDPNICQKLYNKTMSEFFNGVGLKDALLDDRKKFEKYDQNYDKMEGEVNNG